MDQFELSGVNPAESTAGLFILEELLAFCAFASGSSLGGCCCWDVFVLGVCGDQLVFVRCILTFCFIELTLVCQSLASPI